MALSSAAGPVGLDAKSRNKQTNKHKLLISVSTMYILSKTSGGHRSMMKTV